MDDLLIFTPSKQSHMTKLEDLLKALLKNGLQISPKKCHLSKKDLQYMGNTIFIHEKRICVKPLHSQLEAIQKLKLSTIVKVVEVSWEWLISLVYFVKTYKDF